MELADASGSIVAKVWADSPALAGQFEAHEFVAFNGSVKSYQDQLQLTRSTNAARRPRTTAASASTNRS